MSGTITVLHHRWPVVVALIARLAADIPCLAGFAQPTPTLDWMGQSWHIAGSTTAVIDRNGYAAITCTARTADSTLHVNRIVRTDSNDSSWINEFGTPWIEVTWEDNAQFRGVDVFIDDEAHPNNPRVQFGSLFNCEGIAYTRYDAIEEKTILSGDVCDVPNDPGSRTAGDVHTMYVGKRVDGAID